ncbi:MAG: 2-C-methyl-D-erythritol 4-phosphate cytidylyltransferase [Clostridia bacterium]|nr:2-C-methyl-D-erythritol 4-phosphate cytidylyltransferase [Clostridia bacterium]
MGFIYQLCRALRAVNGKFRPRTAAIILAGGEGLRMQTQNGETKQMRYVDGKPVVVHSLLAFERSPYIDEIVLVTRKEEKERIKTWLAEYKIGKVSKIVLGGDTRQKSAENGLDAISPSMKFVAIHDAARCLITPEMIGKVISAAYAHRAASAGAPVTDTVKETDVNGYVLKTPDRATLWAAQTPQVFQTSLYRVAVETAKKASFAATDDNMLVERLGQTVKMVDCGRENIKITTPVDLILAEAILENRRKK